MNNQNRKIAIYCRLCKKDDTRMEEQKAELLDFIKEKGYTDFEIYVDNGFSGNTLDRPAMNQLVKDISNHLFDSVIMSDITRIARPLYLIDEWFDLTKNSDFTILFLDVELEK